jgi:alpha,alpha-trehalose phosphorylase
MRNRRDTTIDRDRFPIEPWRLTDRAPRRADGHAETLFAIGNGFIGVRAAPLDGSPGHSPGVILNGFHETWPIEYPENAYGLARIGQSVLNAPDALALQIELDGALPVEVTAAEHSLDFRSGVLTRTAQWRTNAGHVVRVRSETLVSAARRHVVATRLVIESPEHPCSIVVRSPIRNRQDERVAANDQRTGGQRADDDPRRGRRFDRRVLRSDACRHDVDDDRAGGLLTVGMSTSASAMAVACSQRHVVDRCRDWDASSTCDTDDPTTELRFRLDAGSAVALTKFVAYATSGSLGADELGVQTRADIDEAVTLGWDQLLDEQRRWFDGYWSRADVAVTGDDAAQQAIRWNLFQLAQASARTGAQGVAAKGVSAIGYDGHYFWDTEIYVVPFLAVTNPAAARQLLEFRAAMLPAARRRATEMDQRGALFPWRTINGEEASAYYPAGTAQYHIDAAVAHAIGRYVDATGDTAFLVEHGAEVLAEVARLYADLGCYDDADPPQFHLHGVTGPDEYTAVVDDNLYTNVMAQFSLRYAAAAFDLVRDVAPDVAERLVERLALTPAEIDDWRHAADAMHLGYDAARGIHRQDATFLTHRRWDFDAVPPERYPLLLHFHPLVIYRHQVLKQADVAMATYLRPELFTVDEQRRNFDYYDALTTGDSSLSACVQSIVASQVGHRALAAEYFEQSLYLDLADTHHNTADGVHIANAAGVWAALVHGFGGVDVAGEAIRVVPRPPASWHELRFHVRHRGAEVVVVVSEHGATLTTVAGRACVAIGDATVALGTGESRHVPVG